MSLQFFYCQIYTIYTMVVLE